eukprot:Phypoly_transcript_06013.p1 GENE.Phypoly_transcript_06013~~Phypoly_transcript_06013.p1  ORF type:complete len:601 (+),score=120.87 Phypoly_transcript_06013:116-1804(+)
MEQLDYVLTMKHSADSLLSVINDILLFSKLEANQFQLHSTVFRAEHLLEGVGGLLSSLVNEKQLGLYFLLEDDLPYHLIGDVDRLQQILVNMIGNSLKFTNPSGEVIVTCSKTCSTCYIRSIFGTSEDSPFVMGGGPHSCTPHVEHKQGIARLNFEVRDSGCGMTEKQMEKLFTPFYQADTSTTRAAGGTGLGLSICKQLVELFNGNITVQSQTGCGTSFRFSVELQLPNPHSSLSYSHEFLPRITTHALLRNVVTREPARVLVASQSVRFSAVITSLLSTIGFVRHTVFTYTGKETLEGEYGKLQGLDNYNAVLLYCLDGNDAQEIAELITNLGNSTQVVVICPSLTQALRKKLTSLGIRHLSPPLSEAKLRRYLAALLFSEVDQEHKIRTPKASEIPKIEFPPPKKGESPEKSVSVQVLAVEDNPTNLKILKKYLEKMGALATTAKDGLEAVAAIKEAGVGHFDLILMDLHMPNMDGIQATTEIRKWEQAIQSDIRHTIIALTADVMPGISEQCTAVGMDGYLSKPIDYSLLSCAVKNAKSTSLSPVQSNSSSCSSTTTT